MNTDSSLLTLREAAAKMPVRRSHRTLYQWATAGFRGVRLETRCVGRLICTTMAAIEEFEAAVTAQRNGALEDAAEPVVRRRRTTVGRNDDDVWHLDVAL